MDQIRNYFVKAASIMKIVRTCGFDDWSCGHLDDRLDKTEAGETFTIHYVLYVNWFNISRFSITYLLSCVGYNEIPSICQQYTVHL